jgi:hypothetical protein
MVIGEEEEKWKVEMEKRSKTWRQKKLDKKRRVLWLFQNLERDAPRTDWIKMIQLR